LPRGSAFWVVARTVVGFRRRKDLEDLVLLQRGNAGFCCSCRAARILL